MNVFMLENYLIKQS